MIDVQNRTPLPGKAGRVKLTLDDSTILSGILEIADEATQDGTPWDRSTGKLLQADIRTYPVAAGQSITAGDVVDVVGGAVTKAGTPSQAIALTTAAAGQSCEVIYSGVTALSGVTAGQKITSDGVYGVGVLDGVLQVWSKDRPGQVVTGSYVGTGTYGESNKSAIEFPFRPKAVIIRDTNDAHGGLVWLYGIARSLSDDQSSCTLTWTDNVLEWYSTSRPGQLNESGHLYKWMEIT